MVRCFRCGGRGSVRVYSGRFSNATCQVCKGEGEISPELKKLWYAYKRADNKYSSVRWCLPTGDVNIEKTRVKSQKAKAKLDTFIGTDDY